MTDGDEAVRREVFVFAPRVDGCRGSNERMSTSTARPFPGLRDALDVVEQHGCTLLYLDARRDFERLARCLGTPRSSRGGGDVFERLQIVSRDEARPHSLSAAHGDGAFPFHTDTAHWPVPARYLLLRSETTSSRQTHVVDIGGVIENSASSALLARGVFSVRNGRRSFLAPAWEPLNRCVRFDQGCMLAANRPAREAIAVLTSLVAVAPVISVDWTEGRTLLVDNWRCMHARGVASSSERQEPRRLLRALVEVL